jgi:tetratricopeptide (TPR) repeat protein
VRGAVLVAAMLAVIMTGSCSSTPKKRAAAVVTAKNDAAEFSRLGDGFMMAGQYASALQYYGEALDSNLSVDNVEGALASRGSIGRVYLAMARFDDARREFTDALEDARAFGKPSLIALCLSNAGELAYAEGVSQGDTVRATTAAAAADLLFAEAEPLAAGDEAVAAVVAHNRGVAAMARGELDTAEAYILKSAAANEKARRWVELGSNRYALASIANSRGDLPGAMAWARKALESDKAAENSAGIGADLEALARLSRKSGDDEAAFDLYRRSFGVWLSMNRAPEAERCLVALNELAIKLGKEDYAQRYAELLERIRKP